MAGDLINGAGSIFFKFYSYLFLELKCKNKIKIYLRIRNIFLKITKRSIFLNFDLLRK